MKRRGYENLTLRLAKRECLAAPPGAVTPQSRRLAENVVPDTPLPGLAPPPNTVLSSFTPCGRFLVAFQPVSNEVVAFRFKGLHTSSSATDAPGTSAGPAAGAAASDDGAGRAAGAAAQQQPQGLQSSLQASQPVRPQGQQQQQQPVGFADIFEEHWRCCPCPGRQEQISTDFCAVAHGRFLLVCTASPERPPPAGARGAAELVPCVERTTLHLVELDSGCLADSHTLLRDFVELSRGLGCHLWGQLLLVLGLASQTLHVLQVLPSGRFLYLHAIGQYCRDDDALVISQQEEVERRLRQHQQRQRQRHQQQPALSHTTSATSISSLSRPSHGNAATGAGAGSAPPLLAAGAGPSPAGATAAAAPAAGPAGVAPGQAGAEAGATAAGAAVGGGAAAAGAAPARAADSRSEGEESRGAVSADAAAAAASGVGEASQLLGGLKQCLLAHLYRQAQQQAQAAAAAAAAPCSGACQGSCGHAAGGSGGPAAASSGQPQGLAGAYGSTASLLSAAVPPQKRLVGGAGSSMAGGAAGEAPACGAAQQGRLQAHWRRPLDRFCYYFPAYCELVMWKAQVLDEQRLLIQWCPPEMLGGGPQHRHGHGAPSAAAGTAGSYAMLYNLASASVERLFVAHSSEFAAWYLNHPAAFCGGGCACGCGTDWERCVPAPGASRSAREQQQRDLQQAAKELRHRLADELPASGHTRQASPYLDPDLYCFDERSVGGPIRPHHPPHRSLKFMCRCQPERLRFRLDPEHLAPALPAGAGAAGAGSRAAAARARHVVYLFHPVQPFLLVVSQDVESGAAEHLHVFTRL